MAKTVEEVNKEKHEGMVAKVNSIDCTELKAWIDNRKEFILLDVREPDEINAFKILAENSLEVPRGIIEFMIPQLGPDKEVTIVVCCSHGWRSAEVANLISEYGYKNVLNLRDGIYAWIRAGYGLVNFYGKFKMSNFESFF